MKRTINTIKNPDLLIDMCIKKLDNEINMSWKDIVKLFNLDYSDAHLRKVAYGFKAYRDYKEMCKDFGAKKSLDKYEEVVGNMEVKRLKIKEQRKKLNAIKKDFNTAMAVADEIREFYEDNGFELLIEDYEQEPLKTGHKKMVVFISDWHIGCVIDNCKGNSFNLEIAKGRIKKLYNKVVEMIELHNINEVYVISLGDMVEHDTMRPTQHYGVEFELSEQIVQTQKLMFELILNISKKANVKFGAVRGNHSRLQGDKKLQDKKNNVDYIIVKNIEYMLDLIDCDRIEVINNDKYDSIITKINGIKCEFIHGDEKKRDAVKLLRDIVDIDNEIKLVVRGHYHSYECKQDNYGRRVITVGCLSGYNDYSVNFGASSMASQVIAIFGDNEIECISDVILD